MVAFAALVLAALRAVATASAMALCGAVAARRGLLDAGLQRGLADIAKSVTIPALLFTNILDCAQDFSQHTCPSLRATMGQAWPLLLLPAVNVGVGLLLGYLLVVLLTRPPRALGRAAMVCCAFGNSTGLPITLLMVIQHSFGPTTSLGSVNPLLFLSLYLLMYPVLTWTVGVRLLARDRHDDEAAAGDGDDEEHGLLLNDDGAGPDECRSPLEAPPEVAPPRVLSQWRGLAWLQRTQQRVPLRVRQFVSQVFNAPVLAVLAAIFCAAVGPSRLLVDQDRDNDAPLEWAFNALQTIGHAAVPLNMLLLGAKLSRGPVWRAAPVATSIMVAVVKLVLMPGVGLGTALLLDRFYGLPSGIAPTVFLVVCLVTATPTANTVAVLGELQDNAKQAIATFIFVQYLAAPVLLSAWTSVFVALSPAGQQ